MWYALVLAPVRYPPQIRKPRISMPLRHKMPIFVYLLYVC